jgi:DUF1680 family protein/alpha-L-arabinofuranosidase
MRLSNTWAELWSVVAGLGGAMAALILASAAGVSGAESAPAEKAPPVVRPFDLQDVRLLAGPAKTMQEIDRKYLLDLDSNRLLHDFRLNANLPSKAEPLGGWEAPKCELRGHFVGHYLSACALMYRSTGDEKVKARADALVAELAKCQKALGGKYLSAFPESFFDRVETTGKVWAPYYTIHKVMAGLLDMYQLCGNKQALEVVSGMADYFKARNDKLPEEQFQKMLGVEHGGMMEVLFNLYGVTGNPDHLALAKRFDHKKVFDPLAAGKDELKGLHANTNIPKIAGAARGYELTGDKRLGDVADFFWDAVVKGRIYATGGTSNQEHWRTAPGQLASELGKDTQECCCTYNMLKLTRLLFGRHPEEKYAAYYEQALFNSVFGTQDAKGMLMYFLPLESGWWKLYGTANDSFWCCTGTGVESFAKLADSIYFHDADGVWVNLFIASEVKWADKGVTIRQETKFPEEQGTALIVKTPKEVELALHVRIPSWAKNAAVKVNGQAAGAEVKPGTYAVIQRKWKDGDRVEVALPMSLRLALMPDDAHLAAVMYGPLVLAGDLGAGDGVKLGTSGSHGLPNNRPRPAPALAVDEDPPASWIEAVADKPLAFRTKGVGRPADVTLMPLSRITNQRYAVYWKLISKSTQWPPTQQAAIKVQVDQPGVKIAPTLYGIFFEEINHAGDGGLYAELIRNRSFEDSDKADPWTLVTGGTRQGEIAIDSSKPMSEKNTKSLRLKIAAEGDGRVGATNPGFWGIGLKKGAGYTLTLYARAADGFKGPLVVTLESADGGKKYAEEKIDGLSGEWKAFKTTLTAGDTDPAARLVIATASPGTVWLDGVSLFPKETFKARANGLRPDLAGMLVGLKPAFVRFPGGCWVEGDRLEYATRWKRTIGDVADRWNQHNLWNYFSTNGLGFHEYLLLCEDLGAEPLFVINCGMSHKENVPKDQLGEWVQDALDAIEYCNGPADSKWGAVRAASGHPAPFNLKYMEIGNENGGPVYDEHYALFHDAIKAKYPALRLISNTRIKSRPMDIDDEHYYNSPEFFMSQAHKYDSYDRAGPKVYVGEYAVTHGCGKGNLIGALGEAAFMTGMERNSDVVVMASYAPLFVNVNDRKWNPDLIQFDSSRVAGIPSYYVQAMFGTNRADVVLPLDLKADTPETPTPRGAVGVGTWATQAEFKEVKVMQGTKTLLECDFAKGAAGWKTTSGTWEAKDGVYRQTGREPDIRAIAGDPAWTDYTLTCKARKTGGNEGFLILFHVRDNDNWSWWNIGGWGNSRHAVEVSTNGGKHEAGRSVTGSIETGRWYDIRIEAQKGKVRCFLDGKKIHEFSEAETAPSTMYACAGRVEATGEVVVKVVNVSESAQETQVELAGAGKVEPTGTAIVLTSARPDDENSLDEPTRVAPITSEFKGAGTSFKYTFPPYSLTILRLKAAK